MKQYHFQQAPKTQKEKVQNMYIEARYFENDQLPETLFEYTNIEILGIRGYLEQIPEKINRLKKLRQLHLYFTSGNPLPENIDELSELEELIIFRCSEPLQLPASITKLKKINSINFSYCHLTEIPKELKTFRKLEKLGLSNNELTVQTLENACHWPNLLELRLDINKLELVPEWISLHKDLDLLFLGHNAIKSLPNWMSQMNKLRNFQFEYNQITTIDNALAQLPKLEFFNWSFNPCGWLVPICFKLDETILDFRNFHNHNVKQQVKDILSLRKALKKAKLESEELIQNICSLLSDIKPEIAQLSNAAILAAYPIGNTKLRAAIIEAIRSRLQAFDEKSFGKDSELLILGTTIKKKADLKESLKKLDIKVVNKKSPKTTHILLGKNFKNSAPLLDHEMVILTETELNHYIDKYAPAYLLEDKDNEAANSQNLEAMLLSLTDDNIKIALELLKSGGVPKDLMTALFFVHKVSPVAGIVRKTKQLLTLNASENLLSALKTRFNLKRDKLGYWELKYYIDDISKDTEIDTILLIEYLFMHYQQKYPFSSLYTRTVSELPEEEQMDYAKRYWDKRIEGQTLQLKEGDSDLLPHFFKLNLVTQITGLNYPATLLEHTKGIGQLTQLKRIKLEYPYKPIGLATDFGKLPNLETIELIDSDLKEEAWEEAAKLPNLNTLEIHTNKEELHPKTFTLTQLENLSLDISKMDLNFPINQLTNLKSLEIKNSKMEHAEAFVERVKQLPKLEKVTFYKDLNELYKQLK